MKKSKSRSVFHQSRSPTKLFATNYQSRIAFPTQLLDLQDQQSRKMDPMPQLPLNRMLDRAFFTQADTLHIAQALLGKVLVTQLEGEITAGKIVETEAYLGVGDRACHAYAGRHTGRTSVMYALGGTAYVYLIYGVHPMFNIVTGEVGTPHAILVRAIEPIMGIETMLKRRKLDHLAPKLTAGPGALAKALGIKTAHSGSDLLSDEIWIEDHGISLGIDQILASPRVNVDYAGDDALLPYRFRIRNNPWTSPAK
jgi:DNA-3-methyladenine glycosylase